MRNPAMNNNAHNNAHNNALPQNRLAPSFTLPLTDEEHPVAQWALEGWSATFDEVVAQGHMPKHPPAPTLHTHALRIPLHVDTLEELDYQFTVAMHDHADRLPPGMDPAIGAQLAQRIRKNLPPTIKLSV